MDLEVPDAQDAKKRKSGGGLGRLQDRDDERLVAAVERGL
jgi:hypothetical protein